MNELQQKIADLKEEKNAILLVHNYQIAEIQDLADFMGDSLGLCNKAAEVKDKDTIVFCGVDFMAESASIINPEKKVLLPDTGACCPMAAMLPAETVRRYKEKYPGVPVVLYVNTLAESKAEADIMCTSSNADIIVNSLDSDTVLFGPDRNLAWYVEQRTDKKIIKMPDSGYCYVHKQFSELDVELARKNHPEGKIIVHPECDPEVQNSADGVFSTGGMIKFCRETDAKAFIIGTERGIIHRLKKENPGKEFYPLLEDAVCQQMKKITLENLYECLRNEAPVVTVPKETADKARAGIQKMIDISKSSSNR